MFVNNINFLIPVCNLPYQQQDAWAYLQHWNYVILIMFFMIIVIAIIMFFSLTLSLLDGFFFSQVFRLSHSLHAEGGE